TDARKTKRAFLLVNLDGAIGSASAQCDCFGAGRRLLEKIIEYEVARRALAVGQIEGRGSEGTLCWRGRYRVFQRSNVPRLDQLEAPLSKVKATTNLVAVSPSALPRARASR